MKCIDERDSCKPEEHACEKIPNCFFKLEKYALCYFTNKICIEAMF